MAQFEVINTHDAHNLGRPGRVAATIAGLILLPPFMMLALAPMMLFMLPVAVVAIPFMIPAFFSGSLEARAEIQRRVSLRPAFSLAQVAR